MGSTHQAATAVSLGTSQTTAATPDTTRTATPAVTEEGRETAMQRVGTRAASVAMLGTTAATTYGFAMMCGVETMAGVAMMCGVVGVGAVPHSTAGMRTPTGDPRETESGIETASGTGVGIVAARRWTCGAGAGRLKATCAGGREAARGRLMIVRQ